LEFASCGSQADNDCTNPNQCNAAGVCLENDEANGSACTNGSCTLGECIEGQPVGCPRDVVTQVPFNTSWSSVGSPDLFDGTCDTSNSADYALTFTAPSTGTYRFGAAGLVGEEPDEIGIDADSVLSVAPGACTGTDTPQLSCNDDIVQDVNSDSRVELPLDAGDTVTVYVGERGEPGGGTGTLSITLLPPD
jgi:hypothetical protein